MRIFLLIIVLFNLIIFNAFSQKKNVVVTGIVVDQEVNQPLEYATVAFFSKTDNKIVTGGITDPTGKFRIEVPVDTYDISVEFISYKTKTIANRTLEENTDLGVIGLTIDVATLDEVSIIAERTTVEIKLDKKIYNIGKDLTTAGGTVSDALNNVPSVSVDIEGNISLRGNENVRILINGKPSAMAGFGDTNILSQLPAEAIERVEVITSPSARYDAEGTAGILNIILRQKETLGFNGSFNFNIGTPDNAGLSANLNYRTEKYNLFTNVGWRYFDAPRTSFIDVTYFDRLIDGELLEPEYRRIIEDQYVDRLNRNYNANVGAEFFLTKMSSLTTSLFLRYGEDADVSLNNSQRLNEGSVVERTLRREKQTEADNSYQLSINYMNKFDNEGHELRIDLQYENDKEDQFTFINEDYLITENTNPEPFQQERITASEKQNEYLSQVDYVLPIGEDARFEAGYRGNFGREITDYLLEQEDLMDGGFFVNDTISNIFDYQENVNAVYSQYGSKFGKFSFLLGLRFEHTQLKGDIDSNLTNEELIEAFGFPIQTQFDNNYAGLFPTLNLIYNLSGSESDSEESITLGYNRRINRPRGWFINPFPTRSSRTNVFQGNPNLNPAFASAYDLGYLKRWKDLTLTASVYYQHETDSFERVQENTGQQTTDGIDIIRTIPVNLSINKRTGGEFGLLYSHKKWLRLNGSFNFFQFVTEGSFNNVSYDAKNTSWFARFSSKLTLPWKIDWQTNAFYRGAVQDAQSDTKGIFSVDLAFSKEILNDNATISFNVRDLLNSRKRNSVTTTEFFERESEFQWRQRTINLSLIYRFNQQKRQQRNRGENGNGDDFEFEG